MSKYLVIGDSAIDVYRFGRAERLSPEVPTPVLSFDHEEIRGGMAENVQNNVISLSDLPKEDVELYTSNCLSKKIRYIDKSSNYQFLRVDEDCKYGSKFDRNKFRELLTNFKPSVVIVSCYNKGFLSYEDIEYISFHCNNSNIPTFCDTKKILNYFSADIDYIKINKKEFDAHIKLGVKPWEFCRNLIVTHGSEETVLYSGGNITKFPVKKSEVFSAIGCGDVSLAALAVRFLETGDIDESIRFANFAASYKVQKAGTYAVKRYELETYIRNTT